MPDRTSGEPPEFFRQTGPSAAHDAAGLSRHPDIFEMSRVSVLEACVAEILDRDLGFAASARGRTSVLGDGQPIPLMSYGLVEYLMGIDFSAFSALEIGGGNSTLFWAPRVKDLLTLEHDEAWIERMSPLPANLELMRVGQDDYAARIATLPGPFDLIVIDCAANRYACTVAIRGKLNPGGLVILDNSDWYPNSTEELRAQGLIQVDFPDFRPDHWYRCNTSLFIHPDFRPKALGDRLPGAVIGGKDLAGHNGWDSKG